MYGINREVEIMHCSQYLHLVLLVSVILTSSCVNAQLQRDFYRNLCPNVESIVRSAVEDKFKQTIVTAAATLRLFFHDCFIQGCDASIILRSAGNNTAEKDHPDNLSLAGDGFDTVIKAKAAVDNVPACKNKVSCADILAMAARDVIALAGGPHYAVELGRRDGRMSSQTSVQNNLPHSNSGLQKLLPMFASRGLSIRHLIALSGAHTLGFSHCNQFSSRLYNFNSTHKVDPTIDVTYAKKLQEMCPQDALPGVVIPMDPDTPQLFDNTYYKNLQRGKGLFTSDHTLVTKRGSRRIVNIFASNKTAFERVFIAAITKLGRFGVKTGNLGEIRKDCAVVN
ncbi:peroxidase 16-like [Nicotiana sylvestris]|uniref:Peroxidase n=1 Tax=Nicotiana sylvestris TaxID=4096 RepID=A0A1U7VY63_NICSY|nr:PREDICTED: peroxidase 16-like [Nicotiana sylvestris]